MYATDRLRRWATGIALVLVAAGLSVPVKAAAAPPSPDHVGRVRAGRVPAGDEVVTAKVDADGYQLFAASSGDGWIWHPLATLQPGGYDDEQWTGEQCLTGDGRYVVAVVAPWSASNSEAGVNRGGLAYAVDAHTGAVRPLVAGVAPVYFNPGCGIGHEVALTAYQGPGQRPTAVRVVDAATGATLRDSVTADELTSAVPVGDRILAARGAEVVDATDGSHPAVLARVSDRAAELRPAADGGLDLLAQGDRRSVVWHWHGGRLSRLGGGPVEGTHLWGGLGGHNLVSGAEVAAGGTVRAVPASQAGVAAVSAGGGVVLAVAHAASLPRPGTAGGRVTAIATAGGQTTQTELTGTGRAFTTLPASSLAAARSASSSAVSDQPACAVARDDIFKQAMQPTSNRVRWAVLQAVQGGLTAPRPSDNEMYTVDDAHYAPLPQAAPSSDFYLGSGGPTVPPLVMFGILAQESNWAQATWHSVPGRAGNPLIANYYGLTSDTWAIDYSQADCGYGIGQLTDLMTMGSTELPTAQQVRLAVDYATNIAAAAWVLKAKWTELQSLGITMNNNDPTKVENWYAAIWAYNTGVHDEPDSAHGLGWLNNPANPIYPRRTTFLHTNITLSPDDARTPNHWPYQERVFGWMEVPQQDPVGYLRYRGTYDWDTAQGAFLHTPGYATFCAESVNNCDPSLVGKGTDSDPCPAENSLCWWNASASWVNCATSCITDTPTQAPNGHTYYSAPGTPEPAPDLGGYPTPTIDCTGPSPGAGAVIVSDETLDPATNPSRLTPNLMGCDLHGGILPPASSASTFELLDRYGNNALATPSSLAAIDVHQLGGGLGGHMFFTHVGSASDTTYEARARWSASLPADSTTGTAYEIKVFVPDTGAAAGHATYEIDTGAAELRRTINQSSAANQWVSLGYYLCGSASGPSSCTMSVTLRTNTPDSDTTQGSDIAMSALAFVPAPLHAYVALGDSYSSGEGVGGTWDDGTDVAHNETDDNGNLCHRSALSWPRLLAAAKNLTIVDLACSGSNAGDLTGTSYWLDQATTPFTIAGIAVPGFYTTTFLNDGSLQMTTPTGHDGDNWISDTDPNPEYAGSDYFEEQGAQLDLLRALKPSVVTLTVGGNDLGFADILNTCTHSPPSCEEVYGWNSDGRPDKIDNRITSLSRAGILQDVYRKVADAAGGASRVWVVTYPSPIAQDPNAAPDASRCSGLLNSTSGWLAGKVTELTSVITSAAASTGVHVIDISGVFHGHEACSGSSYVTEPDWVRAPWLSVSQLDNWLHPNQQGYQAMEAAVAAKIVIN